MIENADLKTKSIKYIWSEERRKIINDHFRIKIRGSWKYSKDTILLTNIYAILKLDCKRDMDDIGNRHPRMRIMKQNFKGNVSIFKHYKTIVLTFF